MSERAIPHVRRFLGQRLRELRKRQRLSQTALGQHASLSGKFIGEVERGEKSISIDSLDRVAVALRVPPPA
jgi:transcriptional regulator with XRE-family HTH domain